MELRYIFYEKKAQKKIVESRKKMEGDKIVAKDESRLGMASSTYYKGEKKGSMRKTADNMTLHVRKGSVEPPIDT